MTSEIFYCDDDHDDLVFFKETIYRINPILSVDLVDNATQALELLTNADQLPELIFLDINMPNMTGIELLAWLRKEELHKSLPIIMFSTSISDRDKEQCLELGAKEMVTKPISVQQFDQQLAHVLRSYCPWLLER